MEENPVEKYIQRQSEDKIEILEALRQLIKQTAPELTESLKWGYPSYSDKTNVIYLAAQSKHVNLGFYQGGSLSDSNKLLEGTGAQMRHIKIRKPQDIKAEAFQELIRTAVAHQQ